jgi:two-component system, NarL family, sensor histidine kinase UhpB
LATELRPHALDDLGLLPALESYYREFLRRAGLAGNFRCQDDVPNLTGERATACFRIFQEALTNVARHAQGTRVDVSLANQGGAFVLRVSDDGRGMSPDERTSSGHLGLVGMQERAHLLGAELNLTSAPGQGTTVTVSIPASES